MTREQCRRARDYYVEAARRAIEHAAMCEKPERAEFHRELARWNVRDARYFNHEALKARGA